MIINNIRQFMIYEALNYIICGRRGGSEVFKDKQIPRQ
jgi:hypothetical protein